MNRRQMFKAIIGTAVAAAIPSMPFVWREKTLMELLSERVIQAQRSIFQHLDESLYSDWTPAPVSESVIEDQRYQWTTHVVTIRVTS